MYRRIIQIINKTPMRFLMKRLVRMMHFSTYKKRKALSCEMSLNNQEESALHKLKSDGAVVVTDLLDSQLASELLTYATDKLKRAQEISSQQVRQNKKFWIRLSDEDFKNLDDQNPLVKAALQESILKVLTKYLGQAPYLQYVLLTLSQPSDQPLQVSQLWHYDRDDVEMAKFFIYLTDVKSEDDGPFTYFKAKDSKPVVTGPGFSHLADEKVLRIIDKNKMQKVIAPKLSAFIVDTTRCLHMGSRLKPGHARLLFTATFIGLPAVHPWAEKNNIQKHSQNLKPLQIAALDATITGFGSTL